MRGTLLRSGFLSDDRSDSDEEDERGEQ